MALGKCSGKERNIKAKLGYSDSEANCDANKGTKNKKVFPSHYLHPIILHEISCKCNAKVIKRCEMLKLLHAATHKLRIQLTL